MLLICLALTLVAAVITYFYQFQKIDYVQLAEKVGYDGVKMMDEYDSLKQNNDIGNIMTSVSPRSDQTKWANDQKINFNYAKTKNL